jgi:hypothetical protein
VILALSSIIRHGYVRLSGGNANERSWVFGPHFFYKLRHIAPVGVLFGIKYGITNWGLALVPTAKHLLLQSTDLVWTVIFARIINKERLGFLEGIAAALSVAGAVFISIAAGGELEAPALGLVVNLLTPIFLALCITTLRTGAAELFRPDNRLQGTITPAEFTAIKLALSSSVALVLSFCLENEALLAAEGKKDYRIMVERSCKLSSRIAWSPLRWRPLRFDFPGKHYMACRAHFRGCSWHCWRSEGVATVVDERGIRIQGRLESYQSHGRGIVLGGQHHVRDSRIAASKASALFQRFAMDRPR